MIVFGLYMKKSKILLDNYIEEMERLYSMHKYLQKKFIDGIHEDAAELDNFNYKESIEFVRTWDIIKNMNASQRNIYLLFMIAEGKYKPLMKIIGNEYKNEATLRVMVCNAKKIIKNKYKELYGTN